MNLLRITPYGIESLILNLSKFGYSKYFRFLDGSAIEWPTFEFMGKYISSCFKQLRCINFNLGDTRELIIPDLEKLWV